jgi:hypothetical protein
LSPSDIARAAGKTEENVILDTKVFGVDLSVFDSESIIAAYQKIYLQSLY